MACQEEVELDLHLDQEDQEMDRVVVEVRLVVEGLALKLVVGRVAVNLN